MKTRKRIERALRRAFDCLAPPPDENAAQWAERCVWLGNDVTAMPGKFSLAAAPYQRAMHEDFSDPSVQVCVYMMASRLGKTQSVLNLFGRTIDLDPRNILVVYPTVDSAKRFSKQFLNPMVKGVSALRRKVREPRTRGAANTMLSKSYPGGTITMIGSQSPSAFRQIQAPIVFCDEIDAMENNEEGDPVTLAFKRADNYRNSIQVLTSTPTIKGASRIEDWFEKSDKQQWFCPCPRCQHFQTLKWSSVKWTWQDENGADVSRPESAVYVCENCRAELSDAERLEMVMRGEWRATAAFTGIRGRFLNGIASPFPAKKGYATKLHQMVAEFLDAKHGGESELQTWINTFLCETFEVKAERIDHAPLFNRCEPYGPALPMSVLFLTASCDVQADRIEVEVVGHGMQEETWGVEVHKIYGNPQRPELWAELDQYLAKEFPHSNGSKLRIAQTLIDSGGQAGGQSFAMPVYRFVRPRQIRRVFACKGSPASAAPLVGESNSAKMHGVRLILVGTDIAKRTLFSRMQIETPGPRFMHFPQGQGYTEEYFRQLTAEELRKEFRHGFPRYHWHKIRERNEAIDLRAYNLANVELLNPDYAALKKRIEETTVKPPPEKFSGDTTQAGPVAETKAPPKFFPPRRRIDW